MPAPHCEIKFDDNPQGIYHAGQTMTGSVILRLEKFKKVNAFKLVIKGSAEVKWSKRKSKNRTITYRGEEQLLRSETALIYKDGDEPYEIAAGTHVYNFACKLPPTLCTSFEGEHGFIRYTVSATLDRPWKFNQTCKVAFTVLKALDLNLEPSLTLPVKQEKTKTFCCWPCTSQPLYITVEIPATGFVPGQKIPIKTTLDNNSSVSVDAVRCKLVRSVSFISQTPKEKTKIVTKTLASVHQMMTEDISDQSNLQLEIPSVAPTGKCSVLAINYELVAEIDVDVFHMNPEIRIPITIGTVPFRQQIPGVELPSAPDEGGFESVVRPIPAVLVQDDSTLPPPTYEEAVHGMTVQVNDDPNAIGRQDYAPRYPVYKIGWSL